MLRAASAIAAALVTVAAAAPARAAGGVAVLADSRVQQYRDALQGAQSVLGAQAQVVDPSGSDPAAELTRAQPTVIVAVGQKALQVARAALPQTPIIYCMVLGASAPSSKSITGVRLEVAAEEQLAALKQVAPAAHRVGVIYEPRVSLAYLDEAQRAAGRVGVSLVSKAVDDPKQVRDAAAQLAGKIDALWLLPDPRLATPELIDFLLVYTQDRKLVLWGFLDSLTKAGALASLSPDYAEIGRRAGKLAQEVLARPAERRIPVPAPVDSPGSLTVNLKTARQLGLELPAAVVAKARQVFK